MTIMKNKNVAIIAHVLTTVPAEDLKEYLLDQDIHKLLFINHPLLYKKDRDGSSFVLYEHKKVISQSKLRNIAYPSIVGYVKDFFVSLYWVIKTNEKWDVIIALDNLNTLTALVLKLLGRVDKIVYYTIDFTPQRFTNPFLNTIYHWIDKISVKYATRTWNLTARMAEGREKIRGLSRAEYNRQIVVPIGIWINRINRNLLVQDKNTIMYAGGLSPHQGIQLMIDALPLVIKKIPDVTFKIIGMGEYTDTLLKQVADLQLSNHVVFLGYMEKHEEVEAIVSKGSVSVALYDEHFAKWSYYADPSKIKTYLACGLPVITTSLTHMAKFIEEKNCGIVVSYTKEEVADAVVTILQNDSLRKEYRKNALDCAKEFDWSKIYTRAFAELFNDEK